MATNSIKLLTGNSHPQLAKQVADRLGIELAKTMSLNYSNQETSVTVGESVRDEDGTSQSPTLLRSIYPGVREDRARRELTSPPQSSSSNPRPRATSTMD
jgi:ribose-phosphate pyrophosphokinase